MRRALSQILALTILTACAGPESVAPVGVTRTAAARPDGFTVVHLRADGPVQPGEAGAPLVTTLEQAVERVAAGGTIKVHPGEYSAESVLITRPMTFEAAGDVKPVIRTTTSLEGFLLRHTTGTVTFRRMAFQNDFAETFRDDVPVFSYSIRANTAFASILVEDSDFIMKAGGHASGFQASGGGVADNSALIIRRSTFTGGRAAIAATGNTLRLPPSSILIEDNSFSELRAVDPNVSNFAVQVRGDDVTIRRNTFTACGDRCINAAGTYDVHDNVMSVCGLAYCVRGIGTGRIANNRMSNVLDGEYPSFFHHVVLLINTNAIVENNEIDGCGFGQCITAILQSTGEIRNNRITARHGERTRIGIVFSDNSGGNAPETDFGSSMRVSGNVLTGVGGEADEDPDRDTAYPFSVAAFVIEGHSTMIAEGNTATGANYGFITRTGSTLSGSRNRLSGLRVGIGTFEEAAATTMHWNDILAFRAFDLGTQDGTDITCNWWGSASGPSNYFGEPDPSTYTPWATQPVASAGTGPCTGGLTQP